MSQTPAASPAERRLRTVRFGLLLIVIVFFVLRTGLAYLDASAVLGMDALTRILTALLQGLIWSVGAAIVAVLVYFVYKSVVVKS